MDGFGSGEGPSFPIFISRFLFILFLQHLDTFFPPELRRDAAEAPISASKRRPHRRKASSVLVVGICLTVARFVRPGRQGANEGCKRTTDWAARGQQAQRRSTPISESPPSLSLPATPATRATLGDTGRPTFLAPGSAVGTIVCITINVDVPISLAKGVHLGRVAESSTKEKGGGQRTGGAAV